METINSSERRGHAKLSQLSREDFFEDTVKLQGLLREA